MALRVGIDVGGTFTKAAALELPSRAIVASASVATTHGNELGVSAGVVAALRRVLAELGERRAEVELVAFSTTQAMNALLEGDVVRVGVLGMGQKPDLGRSKKRTRVGKIALAPGHRLETEHAFIDATQGLSEQAIDAALEGLKEAGCEAVAVSEAFAVDAPDHEAVVAERAASLGLPVCAGHQLQQLYGLETRTVSAAINASILPVIERTAAYVNQALELTGLDVPLLVLRGDGGAMSVERFRQAPVFTLCSGPAAGAAAALHELDIGEGVVLEVGGTSSNISALKDGRPSLRSIRVMGRPTCVRSIDSWVVGVAGGSMARLRRRGVAQVGPRSAHVAGLPYACFANVDELAGARLELISPRDGDPAAYATVRSEDGACLAITATCAANALGRLAPGDYAYGSTSAAQAAFELLAGELRRDADSLAREVLAQAADQVARAVSEAAHTHELPSQSPIVALGGAARVLAEPVAELLDRPVVYPRHGEVLSSVGAALSLVRASVERAAGKGLDPVSLVREAERACVKSGAAPNTVTVETQYDPQQGSLRAVAVGSIALQSGSIGRQPIDSSQGRQIAAQALGLCGDRLELLAESEFYRVFSENGSGKVAVVDPTGAVPLSEDATRILSGTPEEVEQGLKKALEKHALRFGIVTLVPRVYMTCGPHLLDLSSARTVDEILEPASRVLADDPRQPVAIVVR